MALISEVAEKIYEIKPEGKELENFPLCTVYLVVDDHIALVEVGCSVQISHTAFGSTKSGRMVSLGCVKFLTFVT